jgi:hypothetical protein
MIHYSLWVSLAVALAAAKVQMAKDMIDTWKSFNVELAKKFHDNHLAGKP